MKSFRIGVVSDTHVPDRTPALDQTFLAALQNAHVDLILHAGDISVQRVIEELQSIAPVLAVRGNRDILLRNQLPKVKRFEKLGIKFALMHGHMDFITYWLDKVAYVFKGYSRNRYTSRILKTAPDADVFVFGHTHHSENLLEDGKLYFNPGSITYGDFLQKTKSWGMIEVFENGQVEGKIIMHETKSLRPNHS